MVKKDVSNKVANELMKIRRLWKDVEPSSGFFIPDGDYVAKLKDIELNLSKNNHLQAVFVFEISEGKYGSREVRMFNNLDQPVGISIFKANCEVLGIDYPEDVYELPKVLEKFLYEFDGLVNIRIKTKNEMQNVYIRGIVESQNETDYEDNKEFQSEESSVEIESDEDFEEESGAGEEVVPLVKVEKVKKKRGRPKKAFKTSNY